MYAVGELVQLARRRERHRPVAELAQLALALR